MLSTAAFNAFLKTLEEPPQHAIFILATTEKHKIIPTILSRCQIFDFQRIKVKDIAKHLEYIAQKEKITAEPDALHLIAQKADGALRDSLSIFDQIVSFTQGNVTYQSVLENLNVLDYDYFFKAVDFAENEDIPGALIMFNDIMDKGFDGHNFLSGLSSHYRNILVAKDLVTISLLEVGDNVASRYGQQAARIDNQRILRSIHIIQKAETEFKASKNQRLLVEWTLMQLCSLKQESEKKNG
jgi:DNA polymerase-3 subunit gamma/tau